MLFLWRLLPSDLLALTSVAAVAPRRFEQEAERVETRVPKWMRRLRSIKATFIYSCAVLCCAALLCPPRQ